MWYLWYLREPFSGRGYSVPEMLLAIVNGERPSMLVDPPPDPLRSLINSLWAQDPEEAISKETILERGAGKTQEKPLDI